MLFNSIDFSIFLPIVFVLYWFVFYKNLKVQNGLILVASYFFYGWWQFAVCLFAFFALIAIWWQIGKKQNDFGQVWLALSILAWAFSGLLEVYFTGVLQTNTLYLDSGRSIFSLFNSLFILLACKMPHCSNCLKIVMAIAVKSRKQCKCCMV